MKIVALFGEDTINSRERYFKIIDSIKKRGWEHISLTPDKKMSEQLAGVSLFGGERLYSCDNAAKVPAKEYQWISEHAKEHDGSLLLYFSNTLPAAIKKLLPKDTKFEEFKLKKELYTFIESVYPGNSKRALSLFHEILKTDAPEFVIALLARHLRDMAWLKSRQEGLALPDWRRGKLASQANKFSREQFKQFVSALSKADVDSKSGKGDLQVLVDLALLKYL